MEAFLSADSGEYMSPDIPVEFHENVTQCYRRYSLRNYIAVVIQEHFHVLSKSKKI